MIGRRVKRPILAEFTSRILEGLTRSRGLVEPGKGIGWRFTRREGLDDQTSKVSKATSARPAPIIDQSPMSKPRSRRSALVYAVMFSSHWWNAGEEVGVSETKPMIGIVAANGGL
jgi:hypothetical protein